MLRVRTSRRLTGRSWKRIEDRLNEHQTHGTPPKGRDWRRIHHSPMFWIGVAMCLIAIAIYVASGDLSWRPTGR